MKRASGVLMHISSLWGDFSEGSFGEAARQWVDFLADCGFTYWQTLPFGTTDSFNSPYTSFSAFAGNPYFIDLPTLCSDGLITRIELELNTFKEPFAVDFAWLEKTRMPLLRKAFSRADDKLKAKIEAAPQRKKISRDPKAHFEKEQKTAVPAPINDESTKEDQ